MSRIEQAISTYVQEISQQFRTGHAREHAYRPALARLMSSFEDTIAVNDPAHNKFGAPDFIFLSARNKNLVKGYAEAKDIDADLAKVEKTEQLRRYAGYDRLILTNYTEFRFYRSGEKYDEITIGAPHGTNLSLHPHDFGPLVSALDDFLRLPPEKIESGRRLAEIMGAKARRIRDHVRGLMNTDDAEGYAEVARIHRFMKENLVHDMGTDMFADMYAQTLVYGLFVARYNDKNLETFDRIEARSLIPSSIPFLQAFFDHLAGPHFDQRIGYIVDELCEVFRISDVRSVVWKYLKDSATHPEDVRDPIVHFYEDFLRNYDEEQRKRMGAYYTPTPVVKYIVRHVDRALKDHFGIPEGLASAEKLQKPIALELQGRKITRYPHRVQILDVATGTGTFLDQTIRHIRQSFDGQEGRWPSYVTQNLVPRIMGFELMMAPYTVAHLKLGMTLEETGAQLPLPRLNVYLTNSLEEGDPKAPDLFSTIGLAEVVGEESRIAAEIKAHYPIMVAMGNPPYSSRSTNRNEYISHLILDYKEGLSEKKVNLDDDYIKFIRFGESLIEKTGQGILAYITNNSYLDGVTHRKMREHLLTTFDVIHIFDLHGNAKKRESDVYGSKDENVFEIAQGVAIIVAVKREKPKGSRSRAEPARLFFAEVFGTRQEKFSALATEPEWSELAPRSPAFYFAPKDLDLQDEYDQHISLADLMPIRNSGVKTDRDPLFIAIKRSDIVSRFRTLLSGMYSDGFKEKYRVEDSGSYKFTKKLQGRIYSEAYIKTIQYRLFDYRYMYYDPALVSRPAAKVSKHLLAGNNIGLIFKRQAKNEGEYTNFFVSSSLIIDGLFAIDPLGREVIAPLYIHHDEGETTVNYSPRELKRLTGNLTAQPRELEVFDYVYGRLHDPLYRHRYVALLRLDYPRVPVPQTDDEFAYFVDRGRELRELHLLTSPSLSKVITSYPVAGLDAVERIKYQGGRVWINEDQYFGDLPSNAWNFRIGGYSPLQKFLKDRRGVVLTNEEILGFQKIATALAGTASIMDEMGSRDVG